MSAYCVVAAAAVAAVACAGSLDWLPAEREHLEQALWHLNMTVDDLRFEKDVGEPCFVFSTVSNVLHDSVTLPHEADLLCAVADNGFSWTGAAARMDVRLAGHAGSGTVEPVDFSIAGPELAEPLQTFYGAAADAAACLEQAFRGLSRREQIYLAASYLADVFNAEDHEEVLPVLERAGIPPAVTAHVIEENLELDPAPGAERYLDLVKSVDRGALLQAGRLLTQATERLRQETEAVEAWPTQCMVVATPLGAVRLGTLEDEIYSEGALLVLDPGGNDRYKTDAASANGLSDRALCAVVDLGGSDRYAGEGIVGPGGAVWGCAVLLDAAGDDQYMAAYMGQGCAVFGTAMLTDEAGDDVYRAHAVAQGAAYTGLAVLHDAQGHDIYDVGFYGQAYAGLLAGAWLIDDDGNDRYIAGGRQPDYERHDDRYLSLAQGFAIGMRPFAGGGVAALIDRRGNDTYVADIYGQGVGYWYGLGVLADSEGNDTYTMYHYGQGSGIHLSGGLLHDGAGNDTYTGYILAQGNAHDYAVGMLFDRAGDDTYTADHHAQGRALNTALAVLVDGEGKDGYFARRNEEAQGIGNSGGRRECGSLALLLDLGGKDQYSCGAVDGARLRRPWFGIVYDLLEEESP
jgi:hypothetical protein